MSLDWLNPDQSQAVLDWFEERFGIPAEAFENCRFGRRGDGIYAVSQVAVEQAGYLKWLSGGLRILTEKKSGYLKPTTRGLQVYGRAATRRVCDLDDAPLQAVLSGASVPWDGEPGPVLLRWRGTIVGLGTLRAGLLQSQVPRSVTEHLQLQRMEVLV